MIWDYFIYFAIASVVLWLAGALAAWKGRMVPALAATSIGLCVFLAYILVMWVTLERPPMRTMGETRLWYSFFLPLAGIIVYARWRYQWILSFSTILATVFIGINVFKSVVCPTCHRLHVCIRPFWCRCTHGCLPVGQGT